LHFIEQNDNISALGNVNALPVTLTDHFRMHFDKSNWVNTKKSLKWKDHWFGFGFEVQGWELFVVGFQVVDLLN
jgi:hypothetical protein